MSNIYASIPKKIKIIVNKAEDLRLYHPKKEIKHQPRKWRVLFLNVVEKMATAKVDSDTGNPEWLCEIIVTAKNVQDPISLLVTDSKGRHIGQVIIQLNQVPPPPPNCSPDSRPPLLFSDIKKSELEPTKKNAYPKGYLYYWLWTVEYWKSQEIVNMKSKKSLSRSMHDLSNSTLNLFRRKKSTTSFQELEIGSNNISSNLRASPLKVNTLKKKLKPGSDSSSSVNSQTIIQSGTLPNSPFYNGLYSKNPFDAMTTTDISIENIIKQEEPYHPGPSHSQQPSLNHQASIISKDSPASAKKKHGLFNKFKYKKSQSSADLTKISSDKDQVNTAYIPLSLGKQQGQRIFEKKNDFSKSSTDVTSWLCGEVPIAIKDNQETTRNSRRMNRPQSCLIRGPNDLILPNPAIFINHHDHNQSQDYNYKSNNISRNVSLHNQGDLPLWNKSREDMSKRELIDLVNSLENQLRQTSERCKAAEREADKLNNEKKVLQDDLSIIKDELCKLKLRLLEAGDTKYLEKIEAKSRAEVLSDLALWRANSKI